MNETKRGYKHLFEQLESLLCPVALLEKKQNKNKKKPLGAGTQSTNHLTPSKANSTNDLWWVNSVTLASVRSQVTPVQVVLVQLSV